jgi:fused signal recognition particle receptor
MTTNEPKTSWLNRLKTGLSKSSSKISDGISGIFTKRKLDAESIEALEELLIAADMGVATATEITEKIARNRFNKDISPEEVRAEIAEFVAEILLPYAKPLIIDSTLKPQVILVCGVNGNGKTTTIGKLAKQFKDEGKTVMIAACDTFRAAAVSQLEIWANRTGSTLIQGGHEAEPASVAYKALEEARAAKVDILLIDTAGRLQNKSNLMDELAKTIRVLKKLDPEAPHNTLLVLDATTGQNAHSQVDIFKKMVNLTGIIVTKLDGTAKGGVVVALAKQFSLPIHAIGVGEGIDDLRAFEAESFARSLTGI